MPNGSYQVSEEGGDQPATNLADYQKSIRCINTANDDQVVLDQPADDPDASVDVGFGDDIVCTITNVRETTTSPPEEGPAVLVGRVPAPAVLLVRWVTALARAPAPARVPLVGRQAAPAVCSGSCPSPASHSPGWP